MSVASKWPKVLSPLTEEQRRISDDFMKHWHEVLPSRFSVVDRFNHLYAVRHSPPGFRTTLEIGAGSGEHLRYERLTPEQEANYHALDLRENMGAQIRNQFPRIRVTIGDCQEPLPFEDDAFDRILAIHVLEHLPNLPAAVRQMHRVINKRGGVLLSVIPCEGGLAYGFRRRISAQRIFEKRYKQPYRWFIEREHLNRPGEILEELDRCFRVEQRRFFPLPIPMTWCNLCIGLRLVPR
ncbi:MAG: class I SAM-dependent methyltransferase [Verrucomicrobiae bacterium]|nr:class I SAM-dependent methyltransferase [Verrucomicrobiae bacterium]